jgi:acid phosphatase family membrane protein YuiD
MGELDPFFTNSFLWAALVPWAIAVVVIYDAVEVRRHAGKYADRINVINERSASLTADPGAA